MADFTAGLLAAVSILAGLVGAPRRGDRARASRCRCSAPRSPCRRSASSRSRRSTARRGERPRAGDRRTTSPAHGARVRAAEELEPYYRAYRAADGFFVLTCLNEAQRRTDAAAARARGSVRRPTRRRRRPREAERAARAAARAPLRGDRSRAEPAAHWIRRLRAAGVPAAQVRTLDQLYDDPQARANGLVQEVRAPAGGDACGCSAACSRSTARRPARGAACPRSASTRPRCWRTLGRARA